MKKILQEIRASIILTTKDCLSHSALLVEFSLGAFIYSMVSIYLYKGENSPNSVFYMLLGAGAMGVWESTLLGGAWALRDEKEQGLLEYYLCAPSNLLAIIFGKCIVYTVIGLIVILEIVLFIYFNFDLSGIFVDYYKLSFAFLLLIFCFSIMGFILSFGFLLIRSFVHVSNFLSDSIKLFCGVLFPITVLPVGFKVISVILPPTWGVEIMRTSLINNSDTYVSFNGALLIIILLATIYITGTIYLYKTIETKIRIKGELSKF